MNAAITGMMVGTALYVSNQDCSNTITSVDMGCSGTSDCGAHLTVHAKLGFDELGRAERTVTRCPFERNAA